MTETKTSWCSTWHSFILLSTLFGLCDNNPKNIMSIRNYFENIAEAIREKTGTTDTFTPSQMPDAIRAISSKPSLKEMVLTLNATANDYTDLWGYRYIFTASSIYQNGANRQPYHAFNTTYGDTTSGDIAWHPDSGVPQWLQVQYPSSLTIKKFRLKNRTGNVEKPNAFILQGSNDGTVFNDIQPYDWTTSGSNQTIDCVVDVPKPYIYYRIYITAVSSSPYGVIAQWRIMEVA